MVDLFPARPAGVQQCYDEVIDQFPLEGRHGHLDYHRSQLQPMLTEITALGGLIGLIVSLVLLTWQTREVAKQTRISNAIAGASAVHESTNSLREIYLLFVDRPALRAYFYGRKPCPRRGPQRDRVISIADMLADVLDCGLEHSRLVSASESREAWTSYSQHLLAYSPALADLVREHADWWPQLSSLLPEKP